MADKKETSKKDEKPEVDIIRGRMPVAIAAVIKHSVDSEMKDAEVAAMFRTTNGKIADLRADRNFAYVDDSFKPTKEQKQQALDYAAQCDDEAKIVKMIKALGVATAEEAEAAEEARKAARKSPGKPKPESKSKKGKKKEPEPEDDDEELEEDDLDGLLDD